MAILAACICKIMRSHEDDEFLLGEQAQVGSAVIEKQQVIDLRMSAIRGEGNIGRSSATGIEAGRVIGLRARF